MPGGFALKPLLMRVWHAPENFRLMDPLPLFHRRGIILAAVLIAICFLWPATHQPEAPVVREAQLDFNNTAPPMQAELVSPSASNGLPVQPAQPATQPQRDTSSAQPFQESNSGQQWRSYRIESGKTMAQLFRDNNLPPADVYAMAQVEGRGKPLSNLQRGQLVKIRQDERGVVTALTIDTGDDQQVLFTRQADGSFLRAQ